MRMSEFWRLVTDEFGEVHGRTLVRDHVVGGLGHRSAERALDDGEEPRAVWLALCQEMEVPEHRRWGSDQAAGPSRPTGGSSPPRTGHGVSRASNTRSV